MVRRIGSRRQACSPKHEAQNTHLPPKLEAEGMTCKKGKAFYLKYCLQRCISSNKAIPPTPTPKQLGKDISYSNHHPRKSVYSTISQVLPFEVVLQSCFQVALLFYNCTSKERGFTFSHFFSNNDKMVTLRFFKNICICDG